MPRRKVAQSSVDEPQTKKKKSAASAKPKSSTPTKTESVGKGTKSTATLKKKKSAQKAQHKIKTLKPADEYTKVSNFSLKSLLQEPSWTNALEDVFSANYCQQLEDLLASDYENGLEVFPPKELIFNGFHLTPLAKVKVVILGQDPYHDDNQAHGLSFSVPKGIPPPPTLKNIYKELVKDIPGFTTPDHGCLENWAKEGVFLLNAFLTVQAHCAGSHARYGWQQFTDAVIRTISNQCKGVVFVLWGNFAHTKAPLVDEKKHAVIKTYHPSPLSFNKFSGCKCFSKANAALEGFGKTPVDWTL